MKTNLGIELGSTRIKAVAIDETYKIVSSADFTWESETKDGIWTYDLNQAWTGIKAVLKQIKDLNSVASVGISGMMHGYLAFDKDWNLLVPFRTWQNTITAQAAKELTERFNFNIPQRWSIAHLYQAILNEEEHISKISHITTLSGYIHYMLTGVNAVGIGEASGIFPIDSKNLCYNQEMLKKFNNLILNNGFNWKVEDILPKVLVAGEQAGTLTKHGAEILDNLLLPGTPFAPPEGDAGTGMVATNSITERTGNISAGTSIFSMVVLEKALKNPHKEIDLVTTPTGKDVAMVHCNNCTNDSNQWISVLKEAAELFNAKPQTKDLYTALYEKSLEADSDCGGILACNYMAGEDITKFNTGVPLVIRKPNCKFTLSNFMRATLYSSIATLKFGMDILTDEKVEIDVLTGHGGFFKTVGVGQRYMAAMCNTPITCMEAAGDGGAYGMAVLASYIFNSQETLEEYLEKKVFKETTKETLYPDSNLAEDFERYFLGYKKLLQIEKTAVSIFNQ